MQYMVCRIARISLNKTVAVITQYSPAGHAVLKISIGDELDRIVCRRLNHTDVVNQTFSVAQQAENKIIPLFRSYDRLSNGAIRVSLPRRLRAFIACIPCFGATVIRIWIAQFEARSAAIGHYMPVAVIVIANLVDRIS